MTTLGGHTTVIKSFSMKNCTDCPCFHSLPLTAPPHCRHRDGDNESIPIDVQNEGGFPDFCPIGKQTREL